MRSYSASELTYLQSRTSYLVRGLVLVQPRDRATGNRVYSGFWTGEDDRDFNINGTMRSFVGGGGLRSLDAIVMQTGLTVRMQRVTLSPLLADVAQLLRGYDAWRAPTQIFRAFFDPLTGDAIATPRSIWKGVIDRSPIQTPAIGGEANVDLTLSSASETLTRGLTLTRSDATQSQRGGDRFYRYKDISGSVSVAWGEIKAAAAGGQTTTSTNSSK